MNLAFENHPKIKLRLHVTIGALLFLNFVLIIARIANKGTPKTRSNTWGIAVCLKAAIFLAYQVLTAHAERFKRWASAKAYMILNFIDTICSLHHHHYGNEWRTQHEQPCAWWRCRHNKYHFVVLESLASLLSSAFAVGDTSNNMAPSQARQKDQIDDLIDHDANSTSAYDASQIENDLGCCK
ncbi:uncharacterized protein CDV56_106857 [Aspergillus thermomutatus]|uniref:Uncharacterized protein n=1 Tax=Aspergillus thermomutatus TaxID=41047 RepID=A0A397HX57_ASPTH|nr:uncharacterized protein CDV56_106857 [Aspergillus thermomutatus]RHZ65180.1 hypothetical protein CDV56_106857 [Aspergillus thermomutatus]